MSISSINTVTFFEEIYLSSIVWGIKDANGFPAPLGTGGKRAMPFWSSEERALQAIKNNEQYKGFTPTALQLTVFEERWISGLARDNLLIGLNWHGERMTGYDLTPQEFSERLLYIRQKG